MKELAMMINDGSMSTGESDNKDSDTETKNLNFPSVESSPKMGKQT